ncbi:MAG TPA: Rad52/Rad22 family DNA repair protein, partial [Chroococcales cyanobacterium]
MTTKLSLAEVAEKLKAPFPSGAEQYRLGPTWERDGKMFGRAFAYIDARAVFDRLDETVGPDNWESHLERLAPGTFLCRLTVLGVTRSDVGTAGEQEKEKEKSGASDAIKRAAVQFGIARYLYQRDLPAVCLEKNGNEWVLPQGWRPKPPSNLNVSFLNTKEEPVTEGQVAKIGALWGQLFGDVARDG